MSILSDLNETLLPLNIPIESGVFTKAPPDKYIVFIPLIDSFELHADDMPGVDVPEVRISLFEKGNYNKDKNAVVKALLKADFTITLRQYIGYEVDTKYHHYIIDVAKTYEMEEI